MLAVLLTLSLLLNPLAQSIDPPWYAATPLPARGELTFYGRGVMETVYHRRLERAQVPYCDRPACVGYVATLRPGDLLAVPVSGAYQLSMASNYNAARRPAVVWVEEGAALLIQRRETLDELLGRDL